MSSGTGSWFFFSSRYFQSCVVDKLGHVIPRMSVVEEACPAGLHHSGFSCGNHQPNIFFEIPDVSAAC